MPAPSPVPCAAALRTCTLSCSLGTPCLQAATPASFTPVSLLVDAQSAVSDRGATAALGIGGTSLIPGREHDTVGVGYFHIGLASAFKELLGGPLAPPGLAQRDEQGVELFDNAALTPWCHLTGDLQIAEPSTKNLHTTVLAGMRLKIDF